MENPYRGCERTRVRFALQTLADELRNEVAALSSIVSARVVRFHGVCVAPPNVAIVMQLAEHGSLSSYLYGGGDGGVELASESSAAADTVGTEIGSAGSSGESATDADSPGEGQGEGGQLHAAEGSAEGGGSAAIDRPIGPEPLAEPAAGGRPELEQRQVLRMLLDCAEGMAAIHAMVRRSQCSKCGLSSNALALIASGCGAVRRGWSTAT